MNPQDATSKQDWSPFLPQSFSDPANPRTQVRAEWWEILAEQVGDTPDGLTKHLVDAIQEFDIYLSLMAEFAMSHGSAAKSAWYTAIQNKYRDLFAW